MRILSPTISNKSKITNFYLLPKEQKKLSLLRNSHAIISQPNFQRYFQKMRILSPTISNKSKNHQFFYLLPKEQKVITSQKPPRDKKIRFSNKNTLFK